MSDKVENLDGLDAVDLFDKRSLASIAISLKRIADIVAEVRAETPASVDTRRMAETAKTGSVRSTGSAVGSVADETPDV